MPAEDPALQGALVAAPNGHCAQCEQPLDKLRAEKVALFDWRFFYFCSSACEADFRAAEANPKSRPSVDVTPQGVSPADLEPLEIGSDIAHASDSTDESLAEAQAKKQLRLLQRTTLSCCALQIPLLFFLTTAAAHYSVLALATSGLVALILSERRTERTHLDLPFATLVITPALLTVVSSVATLVASSYQTDLAIAACLALSTVALGRHLLQQERANTERDLALLVGQMSKPARRLVDGRATATAELDLRPGQQIVLNAGETLPVDVMIVAGQAQVLPWPAATQPTARGEGESLVAGARISDGTVRANVTWTGYDRSLLRLVCAPERAAEIHCGASQWSAFAATRLSLVLGLGFGGIGYTLGFPWEQGLALAAAAQLWFGNTVYRQMAPLELRKAALRAADQGIAYRDAASFDQAGQVSMAVFCTRGTILLGTPEVVIVEGLGRFDTNEVFALAAGALGPATHPNAVAVQRAAAVHNITLDAVRSHDSLPGLGVLAVASNGQNLAVGNRSLMLRQRISIASVEARVAELEGTGRTVLLVALDMHVIGFIGLQDGLRQGARVAVQQLTRAQIEPVLLSGDARDTCETVAKAIGIEHIRPEIRPADRGKEIRRLSNAGAVVAVIGHHPTDEPAMAAAEVSLALRSAGSKTATFNVELCADHVECSAVALILAQHARKVSFLVLLCATLPGGFGLLLAPLGVPIFVPLFLILLGVVGAALAPRLFQRLLAPPVATQNQ